MNDKCIAKKLTIIKAMPNENKSLTTIENGCASTVETKTIRVDSNDEGLCTAASAANSVNLPDSVLNKLYHSYSIKQRRASLIWFLFASIFFDLWSFVIPHEQCIEALVVTSVVLCINVIICAILGLGRLLLQSRFSTYHQIYENVLKFAPHVTWALSITHLILYLFLQKSVSSRDALGWAVLLNFLIYVTLPIPLFCAGLTIGVITIFVYFVAIIGVSKRDPFFSEQVSANLILILTAAAIGLLNYFMGEAKQKRAFLEAKKSLEVKMIIEEQSAEQERLLLSVLPKHVAVKMRQDLGSTSSEPFKKIYMSRHENVSILYADIVGFTAISSTYSAQDLVKMLNELFARFDSLAEKYHQLRIKILGDCYYCISGAPDERPDHAVLCVHMGLSMVKAIKYVQQKANSPVDMRVGIHTGAVLAGILGQRQWQFDVYSKDVELANKMESSGKAGRVHISDRTLAFLNGEFEVEPAQGERREEALRIAGLKTYFITKVLRPFIETHNTVNGTSKYEASDSSDDGEGNKIQEEEEKPKANEESEQQASVDLDKQEDFKKRLQNELVARDGHGNLAKDTSIFLKFKQKDLESAYSAHREPGSSIPLFAALLVQCINILLSYIIFPRSTLHLINITAPLVPITMLVFISVSESCSSFLPSYFVNISKRSNDIIFLRELAAIIIAITIGLSNLIEMYFFANVIKADAIIPEGMVNFTDSTSENTITDTSVVKSDILIYPSYMSNFGVLILIAIAVIAQLTHITKIILMLLFAALYCYCNIYIMNELYLLEDYLAAYPTIPTSYSVSGILIVAALALSLLARHMDQEDRVIFKWKTEVAEQKEMATDMRQRNEALVYNVLPVHVAEHFMKNTKRSHDDLYSQSYSEVGVLFASMPNFSDFYSEETVNNQGLECLRFLNEVISDFDALLELPQFQDIIKIKTIGSTYMAASGINIARTSLPNDPITKRWAHLDLLVEFALELKKALQGINEQSFNHFVLKMGINHGPITAGVIGARKPHYDIWGNTVNVASRMESTGKAGAIQVTEETCSILQEFGYSFQQRGLVSVKGKGQLMTYYLQGKTSIKSANVANSPKNQDSHKNTDKKTSLSPTESIKDKAKVLNNIKSNDNPLEDAPEFINKSFEKDPRSPRAIRENLHHGKSSGNFEDVEVDIKTPLLQINLNNTVLMSNDRNNSEKDSLID